MAVTAPSGLEKILLATFVLRAVRSIAHEIDASAGLRAWPNTLRARFLSEKASDSQATLSLSAKAGAMLGWLKFAQSSSDRAWNCGCARTTDNWLAISASFIAVYFASNFSDTFRVIARRAASSPNPV